MTEHATGAGVVVARGRRGFGPSYRIGCSPTPGRTDRRVCTGQPDVPSLLPSIPPRHKMRGYLTEELPLCQIRTRSRPRGLALGFRSLPPSIASTGATAAACSPGYFPVTPRTVSFATTSRWRFPTSWRSSPSTPRPNWASALTGTLDRLRHLEVPDGVGVGSQQPEVFPAARPAAVVRDDGPVGDREGDLLVARRSSSGCRSLNGWVQGMGWPPSGKSMVHWFSTQGARPRRLVRGTSSHNLGGGLVATFASWGVTLFRDWGAKFYFNALIAAVVAIVAFFLLRDTPESEGLPPIEEYENDYPPGLPRRAASARSRIGRSSSGTFSITATCGRLPSRTRLSTSCATGS